MPLVLVFCATGGIFKNDRFYVEIQLTLTETVTPLIIIAL